MRHDKQQLMMDFNNYITQYPQQLHLEKIAEFIIKYTDDKTEELRNNCSNLIIALEEANIDSNIIEKFYKQNLKIDVTVKGGIAYCDSSLVNIIDLDNQEEE